jgi:uncharacterized protein YggE
MRRLWLFGLFLTASSVFGQLDSDTVTIQASRSVNPTPDQFIFYVSVNASPSTTLDQIVAALSGSGIAAANLSGMYSGMNNQPFLQWSFELAVPFTKTMSTIASLIALEQSIGQNNSGMSLMFQGTHVSSQAIQSQICAAKDLVAEAQAQAQNLAAAAGLYIGPILAISDGSSVPAARGYFGFTSVYAVQASWVVNPFLGYSPTPSGCYLEVKFKLLRY